MRLSSKCSIQVVVFKRYGPSGSGRAGPRIVGCSPDKPGPMLLISSSHEKRRTAIKPKASRDREFFFSFIIVLVTASYHHAGGRAGPGGLALPKNLPIPKRACASRRHALVQTGQTAVSSMTVPGPGLRAHASQWPRSPACEGRCVILLLRVTAEATMTTQAGSLRACTGNHLSHSDKCQRARACATHWHARASQWLPAKAGV